MKTNLVPDYKLHLLLHNALYWTIGKVHFDVQVCNNDRAPSTSYFPSLNYSWNLNDEIFMMELSVWGINFWELLTRNFQFSTSDFKIYSTWFHFSLYQKVCQRQVSLDPYSNFSFHFISELMMHTRTLLMSLFKFFFRS